MAIHIDPNNGVITVTKEGSNKARIINLPELGWDLKNVSFAAQIPSFAGNISLPVDVLLRNDDGTALAMIVSGIPMEDEKQLRTIADVYGNSAKRAYGNRPAVYFVDGEQCKAAHGLLGTFKNDPQLMKKDIFADFIASHNIQEQIVFKAMLDDAELAKQFLTGKLDADKMNQTIGTVLLEAEMTGFSKYYETLCPDDEARKSLPKQAVLLGGMGEENYMKFTKHQMFVVHQALQNRSLSILRQGIENDTWLPVPEEFSMENNLMEWAFRFNGWNRQKDIIKHFTVPCYKEPNMELLADYAFTDPKGKPILLFLRDTLDLSEEKMFITAEFYARSCKAKHGITPFVLMYGKSGAVMKMGALSGGFNAIKQTMAKMQLIAQVACINITEHYAWNELMPRIAELQEIRDLQQRFKKQIEIIGESVKATTEQMKDPEYVKENFTAISEQYDLLEEEFWKKLNGETIYEDTRKKELSTIRTIVADKRIAAGIL